MGKELGREVESLSHTLPYTGNHNKDHLVNAWIHTQIKPLISDRLVIPMDIINLILCYFKTVSLHTLHDPLYSIILKLLHNVQVTTYLMLCGGTSQHQLEHLRNNAIRFVPLHSDNDYPPTEYSLHIRDVNHLDIAKPLIFNEWFDRAHCGHSIASNISLPQWLCSKYPILDTSSNFKMLMRIGGESAVSSKKGSKSSCDLILFDPVHTSKKGAFQEDDDESTLINAFYLSLPPLPAELSHTASVYHRRSILCAGGLGATTLNRVFELPLSSSSSSESSWKWLNSNQIGVGERYGIKLQPIEGRNVLMIGGFQNSMASKRVDIYSIGGDVESAILNNDNEDGNELNSNSNGLGLNEMIKGRYKPGCCWESQRRRVIVGGGYGSKQSSMRSVEYCDLELDKWIEIKHVTIGNHMFSPVIWTDNQDPDVVYIGGREIGDHGLQYLDDIEFLDLRENIGWKKYISIDSLFPTRHRYKAQFRSRALLTFEN